MEKKKVLILYNQLFHYRIPIFNLIADKYDITIIYSKQASPEIINSCHFKTIYLPSKSIGKFTIHKDLRKFCSGYDVILIYGQMSWLSYSSLVFWKRYHPLIFWSIGVPASYRRKYGEASWLHYAFTDFFEKRADANIFYSSYPIEGRINRGFKRESLFVANNTVKVEKIELNMSIRNSLLFIGTLYLEKGLQILLDAYKEAYIQDNSVLPLNIVGGGSQYDLVKNWIIGNHLEHKIFMLGAIYDIEEKSKVFSKSIACISPCQAGLSVLESMGYGVPYITSIDAITGGESFNIENEKTGLRLLNLDELFNVIIDISKNKDKYFQMGMNAYNYYWNFRKPEDMANGITDALEYVINKK